MTNKYFSFPTSVTHKHHILILCWLVVDKSGSCLLNSVENIKLQGQNGIIQEMTLFIRKIYVLRYYQKSNMYNLTSYEQYLGPNSFLPSGHLHICRMFSFVIQLSVNNYNHKTRRDNYYLILFKPIEPSAIFIRIINIFYYNQIMYQIKQSTLTLKIL